jgi:hypothetical protein
MRITLVARFTMQVVVETGVVNRKWRGEKNLRYARMTARGGEERTKQMASTHRQARGLPHAKRY